MVQRFPTRTNRRVAAENLKRCPLCGAVNARLNKECFACSWHGQFVHDPESVEEGLNDLMDRCPELVSAMMYEPPKISLVDRVRACLRRVFRRRVDLFA